MYQQPIPDPCDRNFLSHTDVSAKKKPHQNTKNESSLTKNILTG